ISRAYARYRSLSVRIQLDPDSLSSSPLLIAYYSLSTRFRRELHSFPTRRSSDLLLALEHVQDVHDLHASSVGSSLPILSAHGGRSEEHTSELQSRFELVCRLLLEKNKYLLKLTSFYIP